MIPEEAAKSFVAAINAGDVARLTALMTEWRAETRGGKVAVWQLHVNPEPMRAIMNRMDAS